MRKQRDIKCDKCNNWFIAVYDKKGLFPVRCNTCIKYDKAIRRIKIKYDIDFDEAKQLVDLRNEKRCECCRDKWRADPFATQYHIDHDHDTDEIRGVVCQSCNSMFGQMEGGNAKNPQDYHYKWLEYKLSRWPRYIGNTN